MKTLPNGGTIRVPIDPRMAIEQVLKEEGEPNYNEMMTLLGQVYGLDATAAAAMLAEKGLVPPTAAPMAAPMVPQAGPIIPQAGPMMMR